MKDQSVTLAEQRVPSRNNRCSQSGWNDVLHRRNSVHINIQQHASPLFSYPSQRSERPRKRQPYHSASQTWVYPCQEKRRRLLGQVQKINEAARCSREKRCIGDKVVESKVLALLEDNARLKAELLALKFKFGLIKDPTDSPAQICSFGPHYQTSPAIPYNCTQYKLDAGGEHNRKFPG